MEPEYRYQHEIREGDPIAPQPERIRTLLKPHQLASLHKALVIEQTGKVNYNIENPDPYLNSLRRLSGTRRATYRNNFKIYTNIGVLGDMVGYGKTLVALGVIASTPAREIYTTPDVTYSYMGAISKGNIRIECEMVQKSCLDGLIDTTLVVVPIGPVYIQWKATLEEHTSLKYLAINDLGFIKKHCPPKDSSRAQLKEFFEKYDVVVIKHTTLQTLLNYYEQGSSELQPIRGFARIMVDEAPDFLTKVPMLYYRFLWFISATYLQLMYQPYRANGMGAIVREMLSDERLLAIMVRCEPEFTKKSFSVPAYREVMYACAAPAYMKILEPFLTPTAIQLINANDIAGAINELGGRIETEANMVGLVSRNLQREIFNKEREREYIQGLDMEAEAKASKLKLIDADLDRVRQKKASLEERISKIAEDVCSICYDAFESPVMLPCTHVFCGQCILKWFEVSHTNPVSLCKQCPTCRTAIDKRQIVAITKEARPQTTPAAPKRDPTKVEMLVDIITKKPEGRFLVFSTYDSTFAELRRTLQEHSIQTCELKGTTTMMMNNLEKFKNNEVRVILLNTQYAGSGIDISCATDVILFHQMGEVSKQAIGRAQRVGRKDTLTVHRLCYPNEINTLGNGR